MAHPSRPPMLATQSALPPLIILWEFLQPSFMNRGNQTTLSWLTILLSAASELLLTIIHRNIFSWFQACIQNFSWWDVESAQLWPSNLGHFFPPIRVVLSLTFFEINGRYLQSAHLSPYTTISQFSWNFYNWFCKHCQFFSDDDDGVGDGNDDGDDIR